MEKMNKIKTKTEKKKQNERRSLVQLLKFI